MRLTYILAVVIAATLHASGAALATTKDSKVTIANVASADIVDGTHADGKRLLRQAEKYTKNKDKNNIEDEIEDEEIFLGKLGKYLKNIPSEMKENFKVAKAKEHLQRSRNRRKWIREQGFEPTS